MALVLPAVTPDFAIIDYLKSGSPMQRHGHRALTSSAVLSDLAAYQPLLAGTLPLNLFTPQSDLDILCYAPVLSAFTGDLQTYGRTKDRFRLRQTVIGGVPTVIGQFRFMAFDFEIFGQPVPIKEQAGYRHLVVEHRLLAKHGASLFEEVLRLKMAGIKTEPAFAHVLQLPGDPYQALLRMYREDET
jgi:hypothetical protein